MSESAASSRTWKTILGWTLGSLVALLIFAFAYDEKLQPYDYLVPAPIIVPGPATNGYLARGHLLLSFPLQSDGHPLRFGAVAA